MDNTGGSIRRLLTVAEIAEELRATRGTAFRWIKTESLTGSERAREDYRSSFLEDAHRSRALAPRPVSPRA
jgi:hypothetical protein